MRVSMSAMGSVIMGSPACLDHARNLATQCQEPEANPAKLELAVVAARSPAHLASVVMAHDELGPAVEFRKLRSTRHGFPLRSGRAEGHAELLEQRAPFLVGLGR